MKTAPLLALSAVLAVLGAVTFANAAEQPSPADAPKPLGVFKSWTTATYGSGAEKACYAFTTMKLPEGSKETPAMLTVTERADFRDEISLSQGITYSKGAKVTLEVGTTKLDFFTKDNLAFALESADTIKAFLAGKAVKATATAPGAKAVSDQFSLEGFGDAYKTIVKACPPAGT